MKTLLPAAILFSGINCAFAAEPSPFELRAISEVATGHTKEYGVPQSDGHSKTFFVDSTVLLDHTAIKSASSESGPNGTVHIYFTFTEAGNKRFGDITTQYIGKRLGFIVGGQLLSAPVVGERISSGSLAITAAITKQQAAELVKKVYQSISQ